MASKKKVAAKAAKSKASSAAGTARPYVQRLIEDEDLRDNLHASYDAARNAYDRASGAKAPSDLLDDKRLQKDLRAASENLRAAGDALREPKKKGSSTLGRLLLLAVIGVILALVLSEELRKAVLDQLFGAEEEFEYTSTTAPASTSSTPA
jgi:hypothetical protein